MRCDNGKQAKRRRARLYARAGDKARAQSRAVRLPLAERLGRKRAAEALDALNRRSAEYARGESADNAGFYEAKNADIETGLAVSGIGEGDVLRRLCEWIYVNASASGAGCWR